jgi:hypothetical protein
MARRSDNGREDKNTVGGGGAIILVNYLAGWRRQKELA